MLGYLKRLLATPMRKPQFQIAVLDDFFPHPISGFRFEEYCRYLDAMSGIKIYSDGRSLSLAGASPTVERLITEHVAIYPRHAGRIFPLYEDHFPKSDAYYTIFLNNIAQYVAAIESARRPFAFTLYPGGGFDMHGKLSDEKLSRVCGSAFFHRVIVTQPISRDYLLDVHAVPPAKILYLQGGMVPARSFSAPAKRRRYGIDKNSLDIAFVANRYTQSGEDKGYDLFVKTAGELSRKGVPARYHVVGPWDSSVIPLDNLAQQFKFHGFVDTEKLREIGQTMDLVLSPNRPSILAAGAFDGFPTGSCVEIGLQETAIFCTDELKLNTEFRDGVDLVLLEPTVESILRRLTPFIDDPVALATIGVNGRARLARVFGIERQLPPRLALLRELVAAGSEHE